MKSCANCLKTQYAHIRGMQKSCGDCARCGIDNPPDRISFWKQFFTGTVDLWLPRHSAEQFQKHLDIMSGVDDPY